MMLPIALIPARQILAIEDAFFYSSSPRVSLYYNLRNMCGRLLFIPNAPLRFFLAPPSIVLGPGACWEPFSFPDNFPRSVNVFAHLVSQARPLYPTVSIFLSARSMISCITLWKRFRVLISESKWASSAILMNEVLPLPTAM